MPCEINDDAQSFGPLAQWLQGPVLLALAEAAIELDLPELLAQTGDLDALARMLGAHRVNLGLLLDAMTAMGLAVKQDGRYANTALGEMYLRRQRDTYLGDMLINLKQMQHRHLDKLAELVRSGPPEVHGAQRLSSPERWRASAGHLANYQRAYLAPLAVELVEALPEFPAMKRALDLGGGPGLVIMALLERRPDLRGALCDLPPLAEVAREHAAARNLEGRLAFIAGDYNQVDLGQGYDLIWASHTLYYAKDMDAFMQKLLAALNPGGVFICLHEGLTEARTTPSLHVLARLCLALEGQDVSFDHGFLAENMRRAGFASVTSRPIDGPMGLVWLDVARKARAEEQ